MKVSSLWRASLALTGALVLSSAIQAATYDQVLEPGEVAVSRTSQQNSIRNISVEAKLYEIYDVAVQKEVTWTELDCEYVPGDGKGDWKGFYNVPKSQKPAALAAAVKGVGIKTAERIVDSNRNYFSSKPRTWNAFKQEIARIEDQLDIKGLYQRVIGQYGQDNAANLGYTGGQDCQLRTYSKRVWVTEQRKEYKRSYSINMDLNFNGGKLLSGEVEQFIVRYDGQNTSVEQRATYNHYDVRSEGRGIYTLQALSRKAVAPNLGDFGVSLSKEGASLVLHVQDNRYGELKSLSGDYKLNVTYTIEKNRSGCKSGKNLGSTTETITAAGGKIDVSALVSRSGAAFESGRSYSVTNIRFERVGTEYFAGQSGMGSTAPVKY